jgi:ribosome maturation factor RimP
MEGLKKVEGSLAKMIESKISPVAADMGYELVNVELCTDYSGQVLRIYIDKDGGVSLSDCESFSREIGRLMDVEDMINGRYHMEVSSPGLDRVLKREVDFRKFMGRKIRLCAHSPVEGRKNFAGTIGEVVDGRVLINCDGRDWPVELSNIKKANLEFELNGK